MNTNDFAERCIRVGNLQQKYGLSMLAGKPIKVQFRHPHSKNWFNTETYHPTFDVTLDWREREKPKEPRRIYVCFDAMPDGHIIFEDKDKCIKYLSKVDGVECVEFVEVLKEENK